MRSFKLEPFLWIHLAGLAALPLLLQVVWLGLGIGQPFLPIGLELTLVALIGVGPVLWMQWQQPFDIFSLLAIALRPQQLTDDQRRILQLFKTPRQRVLALVAAAIAVWLLLQIYRWSPLAIGVTPLASQGRLVGLAIASLAFLASNLFLQVPVSVVGVLLRSQQRFATAEPYTSDRVAADFSVLGWRVQQILPALATPPAPTPTAPETEAEAVMATDDEPAEVEAEIDAEVDATDEFESPGEPDASADAPTEAEVEAEVEEVATPETAAANPTEADATSEPPASTPETPAAAPTAEDTLTTEASPDETDKSSTPAD